MLYGSGQSFQTSEGKRKQKVGIRNHRRLRRHGQARQGLVVDVRRGRSWRYNGKTVQSGFHADMVARGDNEDLGLEIEREALINSAFHFYEQWR